jgi:hypothetical protein
MKKKHEEIVQNAKKFAEQSYDMLRMGQFPDFMLNMQQQGFQVFTNQIFYDRLLKLQIGDTRNGPSTKKLILRVQRVTCQVQRY